MPSLSEGVAMYYGPPGAIPAAFTNPALLLIALRM